MWICGGCGTRGEGFASWKAHKDANPKCKEFRHIDHVHYAINPRKERV